MITNQAFLFLVFVVIGLIIGLLFDIFRILRISFKTKDFVTYIEDILFWIITGILVLYSIFIFNNGEIRFFIFIGIVIGVILYIMLFSSFIIKYSVYIINFIKKVVRVVLKIIVIPIKCLIKVFKKIFFKPISFVTINIRKIIDKLINKMKIPNLIRQKNAKITK